MKVYVSSTQADLEPYRAAVMAAIRGLGHEYVAMEDYHAEDAIPAEKCREDVARCDIYVGIIAWRYGFVPAGYDCSITELEYRTAVERSIPTLIFLLDEDAPWLPKFVDRGEPGKRIEAFRDELKKEKLVSFFESPDDLRAKATQALAKVVTQILADKSKGEEEALSRARFAIAKPQILLSRLPVTGAARFGRSAQLKQMDEAWEQGRTNVLSIVAWGGVGKSALINTWLAHLANENYRGAERAFAWSFYNQESEHQEASADVFIAEALTWFGDAHPTLGSLWEKGQRLAELVRKKRTLLVLDGLEVLQQPPGPDEGRLKDQAMQALLRDLAWQNSGLCLIATRLPVTDLQPFVNSTVEQILLEHLSPEAGAELLASLGVQGTKAELTRAAKEFGGHALALALLGGFLVEECDGDVRRRDEIAQQEGDQSRRMMASYERLLGEGPETDILRMLGLFSGPAHAEAINALREPPEIPGLTSNLAGLTRNTWNRAVNKLRRLNLVAERNPDRSDLIETHPLVRQHFSQQLRTNYLAAWREAHNRLFEYYRNLPSTELPDSLEEIAYLFEAVVHGCHAGRYQEAWANVYWPRIRRGYDGFSVLTLGAYGADLATLAHLFALPYEQPVAALDDVARARLCTEAAFDLRGLGRLDEALAAQRLGLNTHRRLEQWWEAADAAGNLSEMLVTVGNLRQATEVAKLSIELAEKSADQTEVVTNRATLADVLHQKGEFAAAEAQFREAEALLRKADPTVTYLHKLRGYHFCDLLIGQNKFEEVRTRADAALQVDVHETQRHAVALAHLALARMQAREMQANDESDFTEALRNMELASDELRLTGHQEMEVRGLLASAELGRVTGAFKQAEAALEQAQAAAVRGQMRLLQSDILLEYARLYLASSRIDEARKSLSEARQRIQAMGYHRRDAEVRVLAAELGL